MSDLLRLRTFFGLNGLSVRQLAVWVWKRMEEHDAMIWAAAIAFYALFATVPLLALFLVVTVLQLPDLSGAGGADSPEWSGTVSASWSRGPVSLYLQERYISGGKYDNELVAGPGGGRREAGGSRFSLSCDHPDVPVDGTNLVLKAAEAFALATGWKDPVHRTDRRALPLPRSPDCAHRVRPLHSDLLRRCAGCD